MTSLHDVARKIGSDIPNITKLLYLGFGTVQSSGINGRGLFSDSHLYHLTDNKVYLKFSNVIEGNPKLNTKTVIQALEQLKSLNPGNKDIVLLCSSENEAVASKACATLAYPYIILDELPYSYREYWFLADLVRLSERITKSPFSNYSFRWDRYSPDFVVGSKGTQSI